MTIISGNPTRLFAHHHGARFDHGEKNIKIACIVDTLKMMNILNLTAAFFQTYAKGAQESSQHRNSLTLDQHHHLQEEKSSMLYDLKVYRHDV